MRPCLGSGVAGRVSLLAVSSLAVSSSRVGRPVPLGGQRVRSSWSGNRPDCIRSAAPYSCFRIVFFRQPVSTWRDDALMPAFEIGGADLRVGQQFASRAGHGDEAVDHHIAAMGQLQRVEGVLLDQEDGEPFLLVELADRVEDLLARSAGRGRGRARPAAAAAGGAISARAIASICCSPPDSVPPRWPMRSFRRGKSAYMRSRSCVEMREVVDRRAHLQVFVDGHAREDAPALRRLRDAQARDLVRRHAA